MIVGVGVDIADISRFEAALGRQPGMRERLFTDSEIAEAPAIASLAARFAAKEAVAKALGGPSGLEWHDCEVRADPSGRPRLVMSCTVAAAAGERGIDSWHLSLSHDAGAAIAFVVAEARS